MDQGTPGCTIRRGYNSGSHRGYPNPIVEFSGYRLSDAQVPGAVNGGFAVMNEWRYATPITVATMAGGRARHRFDLARSPPPVRPADLQISGRGISLSDTIIRIDAAGHLTLAAAGRLGQGLPANREIAGVKLYATEILARHAQCRQCRRESHGTVKMVRALAAIGAGGAACFAADFG